MLTLLFYRDNELRMIQTAAIDYIIKHNRIEYRPYNPDSVLNVYDYTIMDTSAKYELMFIVDFDKYLESFNLPLMQTY